MGQPSWVLPSITALQCGLLPMVRSPYGIFVHEETPDRITCRMGYLIPMIRGHMFSNVVLIIVPAALWIASIQLEYPVRLALIWPAITLDLFGIFVVIFFKRLVIDRWKPEPGSFKMKVMESYDFFPATNIEHKTERTNAFVTLVFGYSVVALLFQNREPGINAFFGKAILGLIQVNLPEIPCFHA